ncbi:MAG: type II toxin-antitoxin system RelE/ParE family toxin [Bacteroidales bacterium]|nr:type II toxin-antitoxin system RelE/ParE family toxin [Bacteroidales bacterium]
MVKVIWSDSALFDLNDIGEFISKDSFRYAQITVESLFNSVEILKSYPKAGKMVLEIEDEQIRELIRGNYRIVYHIIDELRIDIVTVHHCARMI